MYLKTQATRISIFMSVFDVHVNRYPSTEPTCCGTLLRTGRETRDQIRHADVQIHATLHSGRGALSDRPVPRERQMRYRRGLSARALLTANLLALISCGGAGGSGGPPPPPQPSVTGNGFAPSSGPGDTNGYFPVGAQDQWVVDYTTDDPKAPAPAGTLTVTVTGTKTDRKSVV